MIKDNLYEPFQIVLKELLDACPRPEHAHSFFELVYIVTGSGFHTINKTKVPYKAGQLFLLTPDDSHFFEMATPTQLFFIRFNHAYLKEHAHEKETLNRLETILKNARHEPGCILKKEQDRVIVKSILEAVVHEHTNRDLYHKDLVRQYINTLLIIVARNIALSLPDGVDEATEDKAVDILNYIQSNIYYPEKLRAENISEHFGISESYLGRYFKKHSNETMQQYITTYKLKLVENRLLHSDMRISEIADELGFTDKSHLNRIFKKYKGINPSDFKKNNQISS
ncbi:MAG TPA: AraC family transcriptional regulator [Ohtaekwangia sp.]|uniref:AraC family transcriptional regulator n=1 Tax=Ohtaekwangia sp. TaxID=2066019 RepID=UPI002F920923